ncbi:MAG: hypothetical protein V4622_09900 [Bacteroidota bacterium]
MEKLPFIKTFQTFLKTNNQNSESFFSNKICEIAVDEMADFKVFIIDKQSEIENFDDSNDNNLLDSFKIMYNSLACALNKKDEVKAVNEEYEIVVGDEEKLLNWVLKHQSLCVYLTPFLWTIVEYGENTPFEYYPNDYKEYYLLNDELHLFIQKEPFKGVEIFLKNHDFHYENFLEKYTADLDENGRFRRNNYQVKGFNSDLKFHLNRHKINC